MSLPVYHTLIIAVLWKIHWRRWCGKYCLTIEGISDDRVFHPMKVLSKQWKATGCPSYDETRVCRTCTKEEKKARRGLEDQCHSWAESSRGGDLYSSFCWSFFWKQTGRMETTAKTPNTRREFQDTASPAVVSLYSVVPAFIATNDGGATPIVEIREEQLDERSSDRIKCAQSQLTLKWPLIILAPQTYVYSFLQS